MIKRFLNFICLFKLEYKVREEAVFRFNTPKTNPCWDSPKFSHPCHFIPQAIQNYPCQIFPKPIVDYLIPPILPNYKFSLSLSLTLKICVTTLLYKIKCVCVCMCVCECIDLLNNPSFQDTIVLNIFIK